MSNHAFHDINLHITWHNNHDLPMSPATELAVHEAILEKCRMTKGIYIYEVGGIETHVHVAIRIEPTVLISNLIGQIKGAVSFAVNAKFDDHLIDWQRGYGVVSFKKKDLPWVIDYIKNQKKHHEQGTTSQILERVEED